MILYAASKFFGSSFWRDSAVRILLVATILLNAAMWAGIFVKLQPFSYLAESGQIPLHYNIYFGIDRVGPWYYAFVIPLFGLIVFAVNTALGYIFYFREKVISYTLVIIQALLHGALVAATLFVILLNI